MIALASLFHALGQASEGGHSAKVPGFLYFLAFVVDIVAWTAIGFGIPHAV